ncbi:hypothetical protein CEXT_743201 [Caerostris extrusa]|uniref:Uncharacterized protein n=1 Tax=Caerostris extrusa TaxID=172846 RepID=A0AAV4T4B0_CAEEX|nr:hypothetical protein CEXT_743201 [Caerostris extrusa]
MAAHVDVSIYCVPEQFFIANSSSERVAVFMASLCKTVVFREVRVSFSPIIIALSPSQRTPVVTSPLIISIFRIYVLFRVAINAWLRPILFRFLWPSSSIFPVQMALLTVR